MFPVFLDTNALLELPKPVRLHPVLDGYLASAPKDDPVSPVVRLWGQRDPVDAALDAGLLVQRLRNDPPGHELREPIRFSVSQVQREWTRRYDPPTYLSAADRLREILQTWADAVLTDLIAQQPLIIKGD